MTQIKNVRNLSLKYRPFNITEEAKYRYDCICKYKLLRSKNFNEQEALEFIGLKRSSIF